MGYHVVTAEVFFRIPPENVDAAFAVLKNINTEPAYEQRKTGGSFRLYGATSRYFSWIPENYHEEVTQLSDIFELLGFEVTSDNTGLCVHHYDSKAGDEDVFLEAIAHLVEPDSYIHWVGEDDEHSLWEFDGKTMTTKVGYIVFG